MAAFTCPPELRAAFESLTGELIDYRLAHYSQSRLRPHAGRFTVKKYRSELSTDLAVTADGWRHECIQLLPVNPAFEPITLEPEDAGNLMMVGEFVRVA